VIRGNAVVRAGVEQAASQMEPWWRIGIALQNDGGDFVVGAGSVVKAVAGVEAVSS
jgi:hypothetical protein